MNILRIARKIPPCLGGQEYHVIDLSLNQLSYKNSVEINFCLGDHPTQTLGIISKRVCSHKMLSLIKTDTLQAFIFGLILLLKHLLQKSKKVEVVHVHGDIIEIFFSWLVAKIYCASLIVTFHAGLSNKKWYSFLAFNILKLPNEIICVSPEIISQIKKINPKIKNVHYVHSGIFRQKYLPLKKYSYSNPLRLISVGRLHPMKGFDKLITALGNNKLRNMIHLTILGDGPEKISLESQAKELNLDVHFLGTKSKEEVVKYLHMSHLFVSSSIQLSEQTEGTPTVVMEAMAAGLPVIATDVGGAKFILKHKKNGFIIGHNNQDALVEALQIFIKKPRLLFKHSLNNVKDSVEFDWEKVCLKISNIYKLALKI